MTDERNSTPTTENRTTERPENLSWRKPGDPISYKSKAEISAGSTGRQICDFCGGYITSDRQVCPALGQGVCRP